MHVPREESGEQDDEYEEVTESEMELPSQVSCLKLKCMLSKELFNGQSLFITRKYFPKYHPYATTVPFFLMSDQKKKKKEMLFGFMIVVPVSIL